VWNDRRLARRAARGDSDAFAAIFRRYEQDLYRYCVAILGDEQDAQDALQNTMVKALRALPGEQRQIELKPWLYRVAHNESIELRRRARPTAPLAAEMPAPGASPEQRAADRRRLSDLLADIGELPERHRGVLVMRELAGLDFEEIAAALDTSPGAARQVLYEARRSLQQMSDGREMTCDAVTLLLSDRDGRVARRRDVRAHLRDCPECRRFAEGIPSRSETLAGIAPLPAIAAAAIAKGALAGSASGGAAGSGAVGAGAAGGGSAAAAGGAASGGTTAATGAAGASSGGGVGGATGAVGASSGGVGGAVGAVGGAAAKVASAGAILKSTAAIVAVLGVSAVAVDHSHLFRGGDSPASDDGVPAAVAHGDGGAAATQPGGTAEVGRGGASTRRSSSAFIHGRRGAAAGLTRSGTHATQQAVPAVGGDGTRGVGADATGPVRAATRPEHPAHPLHPAHPAHPAHPTHPAHPSHPAHPTRSAHPVAVPPSPAASHPERSTQPQHSAPAQTTSEGSSGHTQPEHSEGPSRTETTEVDSTPTEVVTPEDTATSTESAEAVSGTSDVKPGQARKEAE